RRSVHAVLLRRDLRREATAAAGSQTTAMIERIITDCHAAGRPWPRRKRAHVPQPPAATATSAVPNVDVVVDVDVDIDGDGDLVALLLNAREPVSFAELREVFPDEYGGPRANAERKLERDKAELIQIGVPIEYLEPERLDDRDLGGYRIDRKAFFLPDPKLTP